ncbi:MULTISPECIES: inositol-3-phosphate synthase [Methylocaldum]|jgi:myo-inositol-1-phosphate synthase|uniref:inositol-3-phosphate synthase n=1 Tax=Methylocaldum sp. GT1TLB TaxID=3438965 RepID=UPI003DA18861
MVSKTGVFIIGALGDIANTLFVGCSAIRRGLVSGAGLVTDLTPFADLNLVALENLEFGGHDIAEGSVPESADRIYRESRTFSREILDAVQADLQRINGNVVIDSSLQWNVLSPSDRLPPLDALIERMRGYLRGFIDKFGFDRVVLVNLTSAEPNPPLSEYHLDLTAFERLLNEDRKDLISPGMAWVYAGFSEGCAYVNFTPNLGANVAALQQLAEAKGVSYCGNDGKTGETLVKTALAPMFACRNLRVMSWEGYNLLGNNDGRTLNDPDNSKAKIGNKEAVLERILGYPVQAGVSINFVPSLGDWKTAWDLIHFQGFMDVPMTMQFTWQGCDSILAAPLVLDLIRLIHFAGCQGESGPTPHLASFFKNPIGVAEQSLSAQFGLLLEYVERHRSKIAAKSGGKNLAGLRAAT